MRAELLMVFDHDDERVATFDLTRDKDALRLVVSSGDSTLFTFIAKGDELVYMKTITGATLTIGKPDARPAHYAQDLSASLGVIDFSLKPSALTTSKGGVFSQGPLFVDMAPPAWNGKQWIALEEVRADSNVRYYVDPSTYFVWRAVKTDSESKQVQQEWHITDLATNIKIEPKAFSKPRD